MRDKRWKRATGSRTFGDHTHTCGVVLQNRVLAKGLEPPGDQNILEVCRGGEVTPENDGAKECDAALLFGNNHLDTLRH